MGSGQRMTLRDQLLATQTHGGHHGRHMIDRFLAQLSADERAEWQEVLAEPHLNHATVRRALLAAGVDICTEHVGSYRRKHGWQAPP
jgi:hypothetical protein